MRPVYLRISLTERCNLRCRYCRPQGGVPEPQGRLSATQFLQLVRSIHTVAPLAKVRLTGGEPLLFHGLGSLVAELRLLLPETTLGLTTNGILLQARAARLRRAGLDRINVSIDSDRPQSYRQITGGGDLACVERGLEAARQAGFLRLKLNTVLLRSTNARQLPQMVRLARRHDCELRLIELMPLGPGAALFEREYLPAAEALELLKRNFELHALPHQGGAARRYLLRDARGFELRLGIISPVSRPFCGGCNRLRLDSRGLLHGCLRRSSNEDLRGPLLAHDDQQLRRRVAAVIQTKDPKQQNWPSRPMAAIGG